MATEDQAPKKRRKKAIPDTPGAHVTDPLSEEEIKEREVEAKLDSGESDVPGVESEDAQSNEPSESSSTDSEPEDLPDTDLEAGYLDQLEAEAAVMLEKVDDICRRHAEAAKAARRHNIASAFHAVREVTAALGKKIKGVQYWKVQE